MAQCAPDPTPFGPQNWEQPNDLPRVKHLMGKMHTAKPKALCEDDAFPLAKINGVINRHMSNGPNLTRK